MVLEHEPATLDIAGVRGGPAIPAFTLPGPVILIAALALAGVALLGRAKT